MGNLTIFNPVPTNATLWGVFTHVVKDCGKYLQRVITGHFVESNLNKSLEIVKAPLSRALKDRETTIGKVEVLLMKLFVGKKQVRDFFTYAEWHTKNFSNKEVEQVEQKKSPYAKYFLK